jgi:hypothetical protein
MSMGLGYHVKQFTKNRLLKIQIKLNILYSHFMARLDVSTRGNNYQQKKAYMYAKKNEVGRLGFFLDRSHWCII